MELPLESDLAEEFDSFITVYNPNIVFRIDSKVFDAGFNYIETQNILSNFWGDGVLCG